MGEQIVVVDANEEHRRELCAALERSDFLTTALASLTNLQENIKAIDCRVLILDLDSLSVDNRFFKDFSRQNPTVQIIGLSSRPFHPELEEAMRQYISSCIGKPVEEEELIFWVKSMSEASGISRNAPEKPS